MQEDSKMWVERRASRMMLNLIALLSLVGLFAACGGSGGTTSSNASSLTLWTRDSDAALVQTIAKAYNSSHTTQIKPNIIPAGQFVSKFGTAVASGDVPDLVSTDLIFSPYFASTNELTDITSFAHSLPYFDKLDQSHVRLGTYQGKLYGLPFSA